MTNTKSPESGQYESLVGLIEPFIELPFDSLPEPLRNRVKRAFLLSWDSCTHERRRSQAVQHDFHCDPASQAEQQYYFDLVDKQQSIESETRGWELSAVPTASDRQIRDNNIKRLNAELAEVMRLLNTAPEQADTQPQAGNDAPVVEVPASKPKAKRRTIWDVVTPYIVEIMQAGQYANAKQLFRALEAKAGQGSPFDKGSDSNRYSLFVREICEPLAMKTLQNNWQMLRTKAAKE